MSLHGDLLKQAPSPCNQGTQASPRKPVLRRAISSAYYALFHCLVGEATRMMISRNNRNALRERFSRAFYHSDMKEVCKPPHQKQSSQETLQKPLKVFPSNLNLWTSPRAFVDLQEARYQADYNTYRLIKRQGSHPSRPSSPVKPSTTGTSSAKAPQADAFLVGLLVIHRIQG